MEIKKKVGIVTAEERDEIRLLFERKSSLIDLFKIVNSDNDALYEKVVRDMGETSTKFQNWWDKMYEKYQWERSENCSWQINFETCEIYLL